MNVRKPIGYGTMYRGLTAIPMPSARLDNLCRRMQGGLCSIQFVLNQLKAYAHIDFEDYVDLKNTVSAFFITVCE